MTRTVKEKHNGDKIHSFRNLWAMLGRSIYVGGRLTENLKALTAVSIFTAVLGLALIVMNLLQPTLSASKIGMSALTLLCGAGCAYLAHFRKDRDKAVIIPTLFCCVVFTVYAITGYAEGTGILWSLLLPIGMCYFVGVRYGIILSFYYSIVYAVIFYAAGEQSPRVLHGILHHALSDRLYLPGHLYGAGHDPVPSERSVRD